MIGQTGRADRSDRSHPWQLGIDFQRVFLLDEFDEQFKTLKLDRYRPLFQGFKFFLILPRERRDRFVFYELELISPLVTSQQSIKENYSHKWLNWVTKTKKQILSYTLTLPIMLVEFWKATILCHTRHENTHTSKIKCPRCTKVKHEFIEHTFAI